MTDMIIETDLGSDPDDFFTLCYLVSAGVKIRCILLTPGGLDQVAVARLFTDEVGLHVPIGVRTLDFQKQAAKGVHLQLLDAYGKSHAQDPDGLGTDVLSDTISEFPNADLFIIGPCASVGKYLEQYPETNIGKATMQGGIAVFAESEEKDENP